MLHVATGRWSYSLGGLCHVVSRKWFERAWREDICNYLYCILSMNVYMVCSRHIIYIYMCMRIVCIYIYHHTAYMILYFILVPSKFVLVGMAWFRDAAVIWTLLTSIYSVYKRLYICIEMAKCCQRSLNLRVYRSSSFLNLHITHAYNLQYWILYLTSPSSTPQGCKRSRTAGGSETSYLERNLQISCSSSSISQRRLKPTSTCRVQWRRWIWKMLGS